jgi:hypothetical protein
MRWWLIAAVYQLQHYSQGSERLLKILLDSLPSSFVVLI